MNFDEVISRVGTHCEKWDMMENYYGVVPDDGIAMWVADMDFRPPKCITDKLGEMQKHGIYGYYGSDQTYREAIKWWMQERHNWNIEPEWVFTTHGLVHGTAMCVDAFTKPDDSIILFTPVYHAFARVIKAADRKVTECPLVIKNGRYTMDFEAYEAMLTGNETMLILCSPHNPGGTVWTKTELQAVADFAKKHDLIIVSDEIHHDLVMPEHKHTPMACIDPSIDDRLIMMTAPTKTFNIAGCHTGQVIITDDKLHTKFQKRMKALGMSGNSFGYFMTEAAYSPDGAKWVDALTAYLQNNANIFDKAVNTIPNVNSMALQSTYLAWVDFSKTGLSQQDIIEKIQGQAKIAASHGISFGKGGEAYMRFNLGLPKTRIIEATERLQRAFSNY